MEEGANYVNIPRELNLEQTHARNTKIINLEL